MQNRDHIVFWMAIVIQSGGQSLAVAAPGRPIYDWDFTPAHVQVNGHQVINAFVTVRNLPHSPVNLLGSRWYALDMYPGDAAAPGGPFSITHLSSAGFESMNLAPGESKRVFVARFVQQVALPIGYSDLLIAGAHMRVLGPNDEFLDVGGLNKQFRVTVIPEPAAGALFALAAVVMVSASRRVLISLP